VAKIFLWILSQRELSWSDFIKAGAIVMVPMLMYCGSQIWYRSYLSADLRSWIVSGGLRWKQATIVLILGGLMMPLAWHV